LAIPPRFRPSHRDGVDAHLRDFVYIRAVQGAEAFFAGHRENALSRRIGRLRRNGAPPSAGFASAFSRSRLRESWAPASSR